MAWYNNPEFQKYLSGAAQGVTDVFTGVTPQDRMQVDLKQWALEQDRLRREEYMNYLRDQAASREAFQESSLARQQKALERQIDRDDVLKDQGDRRLAMSEAAAERQEEAARRQIFEAAKRSASAGVDPNTQPAWLKTFDLEELAELQGIYEAGERRHVSLDERSGVRMTGGLPSEKDMEMVARRLDSISASFIKEAQKIDPNFTPPNEILEKREELLRKFTERFSSTHPAYLGSLVNDLLQEFYDAWSPSE